MKRLCLFFIFLVFLLQFSFLPMFSVGAAIPNLLLIAAAIIGVRKSPLENIFWFFGAGFIFEIFSAEIFGFNLIAFLITGSLVWFLKNIILNKEKNIFLESIFWFLVKIIWDLVYKLSFVVWGFFLKQKEPVHFIDFSFSYLKEILGFILAGILVTFLWEFLKGFKKKQ